MLEIMNGFPEYIVAVSAKAIVSKDDYETVLIPRVDAALKKHEKIRFYYQLGAEFSGIEAAAAWEDLKLGVEHLANWERIAIVTDCKWIDYAVRALRFLIPADVRVYANADAEAARRWITAE